MNLVSKIIILRTLLLLLISLGLNIHIVKAQSEVKEAESRYTGKMDLGLNVTSVISSFSGNGSFLKPENLPFLFRFGKKTRIRFGFGLEGTSSEFVDPITNTLRESKEQDYFSKLGFEKTVLVEGKWDLYIGLDLLGQFNFSEVDVNNGILLKRRNIGAGISPLMGIKFYLGERVYLSSEANLSILFSQVKITESNSMRILNTVITNSENFSVSPPLFLYLNYQL